ncbi:MAG: hypothetical protein NTZ56_22720 [Acidobacteria bacterium]|nr:hypothetical protein [Acidobacteriota bacterium]
MARVAKQIVPQVAGEASGNHTILAVAEGVRAAIRARGARAATLAEVNAEIKAVRQSGRSAKRPRKAA